MDSLQTVLPAFVPANPRLLQRENREWKHLRSFQSQFDQFPTGSILKHESPDFLIRTTQGVIGLEHTEIIPFQARHRRAWMRQKKLQRNVFEFIRRVCLTQGMAGVDVEIQFRPQAPISTTRYPQLARKMVHLLLREYWSAGKERSFELQGVHGLPPQVCSIRSRPAKKRKRPSWRYTVSGVEPVSIGELTRSAIKAKNKKVGRYLTHCKNCWLLIVWGRENYVDEKSSFAIPPLHDGTPFSRIFFLNEWEDRLQLVK